MGRFLMHWLSTALALFVCSRVLSGVHVDSMSTLAVAALVLGFINAVVRPVLQFLSLPITILSLGLFYFVINGLSFALAAYIVPGFGVDSIGWAILGSVVVSLISWFVGAFGPRRDLPRQPGA